jgi:hypothetical protein
MTESVPLKPVPTPMDMSPDVATYVGVLEGTIAALCINECKYRWFLELLTGEPWEQTRIDIDGKGLQELAVSALVRQTGMSQAKARIIVSKRWNERSNATEQVVPQAISVESMVSNEKVEFARPDMTERFKAWRKRQLDTAKNL